MGAKDGRIYSQEEVNAILSRAVEKQSPSDGLSHEELIDTAVQAGISREAVEAAAREVLLLQVSSDEDRLVAEELEILRLRARRGLAAHVVTYVCVNALLVAMNLLTSPFPWAIIPALAWGIALALHVFAVAVPSPRRAQRVRERVRAREQKAREKREREKRRENVGPVGETAKELGQAIERGVATVFAAAAKRIHEEVSRAEGGGRDGPGVRVGAEKRVAPDDPRADDEADEAPSSEAGRARSRGRR